MGPRSVIAVFAALMVIGAGVTYLPEITSYIEDKLGPTVDVFYNDTQEPGKTVYEDVPNTYIVTSGGGKYTAKDAVSGRVLTSGTGASAVINAAIDSLTDGRTTKEAVLLSGTFSLTAPIELDSYTTLRLDGTAAWGTTGTGFMLTAEDAHDFQVLGGLWDGKRDTRATASASNPMNFEDCYNVVIADLRVTNGPYDNIEFINGNNIRISNVESDHSDWDSIMMAWCSNSIIEDCYIHDILQGGCYFYCEDDGIAQKINNNIMRDNRVERTLTSGLSLSPRGAEDQVIGGLIEGNTFVDCGTDGDHPAINIGFAVRGQGSIVRDNVISCPAGDSGGGIEFGVDDGECDDNTVSGAGEAGISITGDGNTISGNTVTNCGSQGYPNVSITGDDNVLSGNTIDTEPNAGISNTGTGNTIT